VEALTAAWGGYIRWLQNVSATHQNKPIMATELGYQSRPRSFISPAGSARFNPGDCSVSMKCVNTEDQRLAYAAFYAAFTAATTSSPFPETSFPFLGVVWWMWRSDPSAGGWNDPSFTPKDKPAAAEMRAYAQRQGTLLSPPPLPLPDAPPLPQQGGGTTVTEAAAAVIGPEAGPWPHKENGIVVGSGEWTAWEDTLRNSSHLDSAAAAESLASARANGVNSAEFIPTWFFPADWKHTNSTTMYRGQATALPHALATDTDDELRAGIAAARKLGMKTSLSPM
jgi:hypothetical protein